jgi:hypothetical protein
MVKLIISLALPAITIPVRVQYDNVTLGGSGPQGYDCWHVYVSVCRSHRFGCDTI